MYARLALGSPELSYVLQASLPLKISSQRKANIPPQLIICRISFLTRQHKPMK